MKHLTILQELKMAYPHLELVDGNLYNEDELIEADGFRIIEDHYTDFDNFMPEGRDYIQTKFFNRYDEAFNSAQ